MKIKVASFAAAVLLSVGLVGCGGDEPAVCTSADNLKSAVDDLQSVDVTSSGGLSDFRDKFSTVRDDLAQLKSDASDKFSSQIDAVDSAVKTLRTSIDTTSTDRSAANVAALRTAASDAASSAQSLISDVKSTC